MTDITACAQVSLCLCTLRGAHVCYNRQYDMHMGILMPVCTCQGVHTCKWALQHVHIVPVHVRVYMRVTTHRGMYAHQGVHMYKQTLQHTRVYLCLRTHVLQHAHGCTCALYTLEHFMKDWVPWEGPHAGVGEEREEIGAAETKR